MGQAFLMGQSGGGDKVELYFKVYATVYNGSNNFNVTLPTYSQKHRIQGFPDWTKWTPKGVKIFQPGYCNYNGGKTYQPTVGVFDSAMGNDTIVDLPVGTSVSMVDTSGYAQGSYVLNSVPYISGGKLYIPFKFTGTWSSGSTMAHHTQFLIY